MRYRLKARTQEIREHLPPRRPIVAHVMAPDVEFVWNTFRMENAGEVFGAFWALIISTPGGDDDFLLAKLV